MSCISSLRAFASLSVLTIILSCAKEIPPAQFSARLDISENGQSIAVGSIYVDGWKYRMDVSQENERISIIADQKSEWTWLLMPDKKMCTYLSADDPENVMSDPFLGLRFLESNNDSDMIGNGVVNGYECDQYAILDDKKELMTYWQAVILHFPIKIIEHSSTDIVTELSGIIEGDIDDSTFTIPKDYTILGQRWAP